MNKLKAEQVKTADLKPHPENPRIHPTEAIEKLAESIKTFGWTSPILVSKDNIVLAGHARLKAAQKLGYTEVPAIRLPLKSHEADAYLIADNRIQDETTWDDELLDDMLRNLKKQNVDAKITAFSDEEIEIRLSLSFPEISLPDTEPEYDESIAFDVDTITCEECDYEFPI